MKNILFTTYHEAFLSKGGGEYELLEVAFNLRKSGFIADIYSPFSRDINFYNTVIHFSTQETGLKLLEHLRKYDLKIILWPNTWLPGGISFEQRSIINRQVKLCDAIVFKSNSEQAVFKDITTFDNIDILHIPACVDPCFAVKTPDSLFRGTFKIQDYILWIGIIEPYKNQLFVINSLKDLSTPVVFIGNYRDEAYYKACRRAAPDHFLFLDPMPHKSDMIRAAIQECSLYIEPTLEPAGKSILEAAVSGANILTSDSDWAREHFGDAAVYVDPANASSIVEGVRQGLEKPRDPELASRLCARHCLPAVLQPLCEYLSRERG